MISETVFYATLRYGLCLACKRPLPEGYEFFTCCNGYMCGCRGLPVEPWVCSAVCDRLAWEYNWHEYRHMWQ